MPILTNARHERFAQGIAAGLSATKAYVAAGYSKQGARQSAARLLKRVEIAARVHELQSTITGGIIGPEISSRQGRLYALQDRWRRMQQLRAERAVEMADIPGGQTGLLVKDAKGNYRLDKELLAEERAHERQAAQELGQWTDHHDAGGNSPREGKPDFSKLSTEELRMLEELYAKAESRPPESNADRKDTRPDCAHSSVVSGTAGSRGGDPAME